MHIRVFLSIQKLRSRRLRVFCKKYVLNLFWRVYKQYWVSKSWWVIAKTFWNRMKKKDNKREKQTNGIFCSSLLPLPYRYRMMKMKICGNENWYLSFLLCHNRGNDSLFSKIRKISSLHNLHHWGAVFRLQFEGWFLLY